VCLEVLILRGIEVKRERGNEITKKQIPPLVPERLGASGMTTSWGTPTPGVFGKEFGNA
jgi:hypothetical protein